MIVGLPEFIEGPFLNSRLFVKTLDFSNFSRTHPHSSHICVARAIFSDENSIYRSYGPHTYGGIPYMGHTGRIFPETVLIYEPSANPILKNVLIWSLLGLIWCSIVFHFGYIGSYLSPIKLYLVPIEPYLALLVFI